MLYPAQHSSRWHDLRLICNANFLSENHFEHQAVKISVAALENSDVIATPRLITKPEETRGENVLIALSFYMSHYISV